jgi:hypothetical protein
MARTTARGLLPAGLCSASPYLDDEMTNNRDTFTAEHRSWQWELVLQYEDGSLPATAWNESTLGVIASWYASNLPRATATTRYEEHYHRNRRRLTHRLGGAAVDTAAIEAVDAVWESLLERALEAKSS